MYMCVYTSIYILVYTERQKKLYKSYISNYFHSV